MKKWVIYLLILIIIFFVVYLAYVGIYNKKGLSDDTFIVEEDDLFSVNLSDDTFIVEGNDLLSIKLKVSEDHLFCEFDADCTTFQAGCSPCCGTPINKKYEASYDQYREKICSEVASEGIGGGYLCACAAFEIRCVENKCDTVLL